MHGDDGRVGDQWAMRTSVLLDLSRSARAVSQTASLARNSVSQAFALVCCDGSGP
jgi:hypothetical protein